MIKIILKENWINFYNQFKEKILELIPDIRREAYRKATELAIAANTQVKQIRMQDTIMI